MSRLFKSAAFPTLIVVVLAFFAQKLIGSSSHPPKQTFGNLLAELQTTPTSVQNLTINEKDTTVDVQTTDGKKYTVGFPDAFTPTLIGDIQKANLPPSAWTINGKSSSGLLSL